MDTEAGREEAAYHHYDPDTIRVAETIDTEVGGGKKL